KDFSDLQKMELEKYHLEGNELIKTSDKQAAILETELKAEGTKEPLTLQDKQNLKDKITRIRNFNNDSIDVLNEQASVLIAAEKAKMDKESSGKNLKAQNGEYD